MKETIERNSSIAWFKLSELVRRGERERALFVLRLLSHSIADKAFVALLEAELLHMLNDHRAKASCKKAIEMYHENQKYDSLMLAYSCYMNWWPDSKERIEECAEVCKSLQDEGARLTGFKLVISWYIKNALWEELFLFVDWFAPQRAWYIWLKKTSLICIALLYGNNQSAFPSFTFYWGKEVTAYYLFESSPEEMRSLTQFLAYVATSSSCLHDYLRHEIED